MWTFGGGRLWGCVRRGGVGEEDLVPLGVLLVGGTVWTWGFLVVWDRWSEVFGVWFGWVAWIVHF